MKILFNMGKNLYLELDIWTQLIIISLWVATSKASESGLVSHMPFLHED